MHAAEIQGLRRQKWRKHFTACEICGLVAFVVRRALDEPEIFIKARAKEKGSLRLLVKDEKRSRTSLGIAVLCSVQNFGYYGMMTWMPSYLEVRHGFSLTRSATWTAILGMAFGIWVFGQLADRIGRKPIFISFQIGAMIMVFLYSRLTSPNMLLWVGAIMGMFVNGKLGGIGALISEAYPTAARATAQNVLFNIGRAVGGLGPLAVGGLAAKYSFNAAIALLASIYILDMIATVFLIPELKGKELG